MEKSGGRWWEKNEEWLSGRDEWRHSGTWKTHGWTKFLGSAWTGPMVAEWHVAAAGDWRKGSSMLGLMAASGQEDGGGCGHWGQLWRRRGGDM